MCCEQQADLYTIPEVITGLGPVCEVEEVICLVQLQKPGVEMEM